MLRITLYLRGTSHVVFNEHALRVAVANQGGSKESRQTVDLSQWRVHVRHDLLLRRMTAAGESRQCERGSHRLQEIPPVQEAGRIRIE